MLKYISIAFLYFCAVASAFGQSAQGNPPSLKSVVIPPSPTAAALGKYGDIPVDMSTGVPSIGVPLYTAESGSIKMPISLSYHASGLKTNEAASWVGLGWSLNAGGVITRTVKGSPDDVSQILPAEYPIYDWGTANPGQDANAYAYYKNLANGVTDAEPDVFFFNFLGQSGKFIRWGDGIFRPIEYSPVQISVMEGTLNLPNSVGCSGWLSFIITDATGVKYYFGGANATEISMPPVSGMYAVPQYFSSWYLTKIEAPDGSRIDFEYATHAMEQTTLGGESFGKFIDHMGDGNPTPPSDYQTLEDNATLRIPNAKKLSKINFANGYAVMTASDRLDIPTDRKMNELSIYTLQNQLIKSYVLGYDYFSSNVDKRLKLLSVQEKDATGKTLPPYTFEYEGSNLPYLLSREQDHWGYYNGNNSNTLIPDYPLIFGNDVTTRVGISGYIFSSSADSDNLIRYILHEGIRKSNGAYGARGMLQKINYPTRGYTSFEYEGNTYNESLPNLVYAQSTQVTHPATLPECQNFYQESDFISFATPTKVKLEIQVPTQYNCSMLTTGGESAGEGGIKIYDNAGNLLETILYKRKIGIYIELPAGKKYKIYIASASMNGGGYVKITPFEIQTAPNDASAGGVRIKKITHFNDGFGENTSLEYRYVLENGASSGVLAMPIAYDIKRTIQIQRYCPPMGTMTPQCPFGCEAATPRYDAWYFATLSSSSRSYLGSTYQGHHVLYSRIEEVRGGEQKTVYEFTTKPSDAAVLTMDWYSGKMLKKTVYKKTGMAYSKVQETENIYNFDEMRELRQYKRIKVYKVMDFSFAENTPEETQMFALYCGAVGTYGYIFSVEPFQIEGKWTYLALTKELVYDPADETKFSESQTEYVYGNAAHGQPTGVRKIHTASGTIYTTKTKYPSDYDCAGSNDANMLSIKAMQDAHIWALPIEEQTWKEEGVYPNEVGKMLGGKLIKYHSTHFQPEKIWVFQDAMPIEKTGKVWALDNETKTGTKYNTFFSDFARYNQGSTTQERPRIVLSYHTSGRLASQTLERDIPESYVWGYNNQYPVAKALNARATDVFYTSFEEVDEYTPFTVATNAKTGKRYLSGGKSFSKTLNGLTAGAYKITYWELVSGTWTFREQTIQVNNVYYTFSLPSANIDDVRIFPVGALMTTYVYEPLIGVTAQTDTNNQTIHYEYDSFGRLKLVRDDKKNILKQNIYHYRGE